jgi:hypothetical protein
MSTNIRPEVSEKREYWISKHRYYELKHFCMQLTEWRRELRTVDGYPKKASSYARKFLNLDISDPTEAAAALREYYSSRIAMVEDTAKAVDPKISKYILHGIANDLSYDAMNACENIPCSRDEYYKLYREFFRRLSSLRS